MIRIPMHTHYLFIKEAHESWERDQRQIYCPFSSHSTKPIPYLEQNWVVLWLCWPRTQLCKIAHCINTSKISWLVHHKGAWVLGGNSTTDFLPNLDVTWRGQPIICINIEYVCGSFDQKYNHVGSYIIRVPIKTHCCPCCRHVTWTLVACPRWLQRAGMPPAPSQREIPWLLAAVVAVALAPRCLNPPQTQMLLLISYFGSSTCSTLNY